MPSPTKSAAVLHALGLSEPEERLYRTLLRAEGLSTKELAHSLGSTERAVRVQVDRLTRLHLVRVVDEVAVAEPPETALGRLVEVQAERLRDQQAELDRAQLRIPQLLTDYREALADRPGEVDLELLVDSDVPRLLTTLLQRTAGEICSLRPAPWSQPMAQVVDDLVVEALGRGRSARAIYPAAMLERAPEPMLTRAEAGERVRLLPRVPSGMLLLGEEAAILTNVWGEPSGVRVLVRHEGINGALRELFDALWHSALVAPAVGDGSDDPRRQLLQMMATGAIDDQIARMLGISLRTVRRRISDVMTELGATSRFQAGAEAVRRGWI